MTLFRLRNVDGKPPIVERHFKEEENDDEYAKAGIEIFYGYTLSVISIRNDIILYIGF